MRGEREKQHDIGKEERRPEKVRERERERVRMHTEHRSKGDQGRKVKCEGGWAR